MKCPQCGAQNEPKSSRCRSCGASLSAGSDDPLSQGVLALQAGKLDEAIGIFEGAVRIRPNDPHALEYLGVAYGRKGALPQAVRVLTRAIELSPGVARPRYNLGHIYETHRDYSHARDAYRSALQVDPNYEKARTALAALEQIAQPSPRPAAPARASSIRCAFHPNAPYVEYCTSCHRPLCRDCVKMEANSPYCPQCAVRSMPLEIPEDPLPMKENPAPAIPLPNAAPTGQAAPAQPEPFAFDLERNLATGVMKVGLGPRSTALFVDVLALSMLRSVLGMILMPILGILFLPTASSSLSGLNLQAGATGPNLGALANSAAGGLRMAALATILSALVFFLARALYYIVMVGRYGHTLGKMLIHAYVVGTDGHPCGYGKAFVRWLAVEVLQLPGSIGVWLLWPRIATIGKQWLMGSILPAYSQGGTGLSPYDLPGMPGISVPQTGPALATHLDLSPLIFPLALIGFSILISIANGLVLASDPNHQAIHDKVAGTYVVRE